MLKLGAREAGLALLDDLILGIPLLKDAGLTAAGVIGLYLSRRVVPLMDRELRLWEMTAEKDLSRMAMVVGEPISTSKLRACIVEALGHLASS